MKLSRTLLFSLLATGGFLFTYSLVIAQGLDLTENLLQQAPREEVNSPGNPKDPGNHRELEAEAEAERKWAEDVVKAAMAAEVVDEPWVANSNNESEEELGLEENPATEGEEDLEQSEDQDAADEEDEFFEVDSLVLPLLDIVDPNGPGARDAIEISNARNMMYEGMVLVQDQKYDEAIVKLEQVLEEDPTLLGAWEALGWSYWLTGREDDAEELWTQLKEIAPNEPMPYNLLGQVRTRRGDFLAAEELYRQSLALNPDQLETEISLAQVLMWSGQLQESIDLFKRLLREDPDRLDIEIDLAWSLFANELYEESLAHWDSVLEVLPDHAGFRVARAQTHLYMGMLEEAEDDAEIALEIEPENVEAINLLIALSMVRNRPFETVDRLNDLLERSENVENKVRVAEQRAVYMNTVFAENPAIFNREDVIRAGFEAWDLNRDRVTTALFYADALLGGRRFAAAEEVYQYVLDNLNPSNVRALHGIFESYMGRGFMDRAEEQLVETLRVFNSEDPFRHLYWARLHFARGDFDLALKALERLEREGARGAVFSLLYHGISPSEFSDRPSVRQLREQLMALKRDGFRFITASELQDYFDSRTEPPPADLQRPWLNRMRQSVRHAWSGEEDEEMEVLSDYSPEKVVMVTFDDALRDSYRYGTMVAKELGERFTMFIGVGDVLSTRMQSIIASFEEIRGYQEGGYWDNQSHMWDGGQLFPVDEEGKQMRLPVPNRLWLEREERMETLREYQLRLRKEFSGARDVLARELNVSPEAIHSVAYPYGEVGQENETNIDLFDVIRVVLNEAAIAHKQGFIQGRFGYSIRSDNPLLYKRYEPHRHASGRHVLRQAYLQHPVFVARRTRAEIAALHGRYDLAMANVELLRRDGYPEEDLRELTKYVEENLARIMALPDGLEEADTEIRLERRPMIQLRSPYVGVDGSSIRANDIIDRWELGAFGGLNLNRRLGLQLRASGGEIEQTLSTGTNRVIESFSSFQSGGQRRVVREINGEQVTAVENFSVRESSNFQTNFVERATYKADFVTTGGMLSYIHDSGSFTLVRLGNYILKPRHDRRLQREMTYGVEHRWRPFPPIDFTASFDHGVVPSALKLISYDRLVLRPIWRVRDSWQATGVGAFSFYDDQNSFLTTEIENLWLISDRRNVWAGLHHSINTSDRDSELYWTPFWEQRHYAMLEMRRNFPGFTSSMRGYLGFIKERARDEDVQAFLNTQVIAAEQGGFAAGEPPDEGWNKLLGFNASVIKQFESGFEVNANFSVSAVNDYIEHTVFGSLLYKF